MSKHMSFGTHRISSSNESACESVLMCRLARAFTALMHKVWMLMRLKTQTSGPKVTKKVMLNSTEHVIYPAHNC